MVSVTCHLKILHLKKCPKRIINSSFSVHKFCVLLAPLPFAVSHPCCSIHSVHNIHALRYHCTVERFVCFSWLNMGPKCKSKDSGNSAKPKRSCEILPLSGKINSWFIVGKKTTKKCMLKFPRSTRSSVCKVVKKKGKRSSCHCCLCS